MKNLLILLICCMTGLFVIAASIIVIFKVIKRKPRSIEYSNDIIVQYAKNDNEDEAKNYN